LKTNSVLEAGILSKPPKFLAQKCFWRRLVGTQKVGPNKMTTPPIALGDHPKAPGHQLTEIKNITIVIATVINIPVQKIQENVLKNPVGGAIRVVHQVPVGVITMVNHRGIPRGPQIMGQKPQTCLVQVL
jgi:hypothetical protein